MVAQPLSGDDGRPELDDPKVLAQDSASAQEVPAQPQSGDGGRPEIEVLDTECILIRGLLSLEEQTQLFEYIQHHDKTPNDRPRAMVPAPKTLHLGEDHPMRSYSFGDATVVNAMVDKAVAALKGHGLNVIGDLDVCQYKSLTMAVIEYQAPDGRFAPHVDHCNESFVFLSSLGLTANFMVKGPSMQEQRVFKFCSGDLLVFNASTRAKLLHSVVSIDETASELGELLAERFPAMRRNRYGVQCRVQV